MGQQLKMPRKHIVHEDISTIKYINISSIFIGGVALVEKHETLSAIMSVVSLKDKTFKGAGKQKTCYLLVPLF